MASSTITSQDKFQRFKPAIILHGGAGAIYRSSLPPDLYDSYHKSLESYLTETASLLYDVNNPATALDAACHAVSLMEDDPLFNCGKGSVFTRDGHIEMEASVAVTGINSSNASDYLCTFMARDQSTVKNKDNAVYPGHIKRSAAVSQLRNTRHPIQLAREVLLMGDKDKGLGGVSSMHGHLSGQKVEEWGWNEKGLERKPDDWFWTKRRWDEHRKGLEREMCQTPESDQVLRFSELVLPSQGTVGCVALDVWGNLAVATSTGGLTNKLPGRIGDTPTVGAGFWADSWDESYSKYPGDADWHNCSVHDLKKNDTMDHFEGGNPGMFERLGKVIDTHLSNIGRRSFFSRVLFEPNPLSHVEEQYTCTTGEKLYVSHVLQDLEKSHSKIQPIRASATSVAQSLRYNFNSEFPKCKRRRAIAVSGTGNGDSFLRTVACRTVGSLCQTQNHGISSISQGSLGRAMSQVAGKDGILQHSAGSRWGVTGEGEGGIIGIELILETPADLSCTEKQAHMYAVLQSYNKRSTASINVVFDFNCGGMWRAFFDEHGKAKVMVFREEYYNETDQHRTA